MTDIEKQLLAAENVANREPEETLEDEPDEPRSDEMDAIDELNATRWNGRGEVRASPTSTSSESETVIILRFTKCMCANSKPPSPPSVRRSRSCGMR